MGNRCSLHISILLYVICVSRHGDADHAVHLFGIMQAFIAFVEDNKDELL